MADDRPLVWLPFDPSRLGEPPPGLRYETAPLSADDVPEWAAEVELYVPPYEVGPGQGVVLDKMPRLKVVQTLTAGVDHIRREVPEGVLLCNGRGIHNASTAELALTLTLASLRGVPGFVGDQHDHRWNQGWRESLADKTVLIVGYGDIGRDIERRLVPFEVDVLRVARTRRDGVDTLDDLPTLLPRADVVILVIPGTSETKGLVDAEFLDAMKHDALLVNVGRGSVVVTDDLVAALHGGHGARRARRHRPRAAARGPPAVGRPGPAHHPARRRRDPGDVAARLPAGPRTARAVRGRRGAGQRDDRGVLRIWVHR